MDAKVATTIILTAIVLISADPDALPRDDPERQDAGWDEA